MTQSPKPRVAIVTQDTCNNGGVMRLVQYIYERVKAAGCEPEIVHYAAFKKRSALSTSLMHLPKGKMILKPSSERYEFRGMRARAIGAFFPEWEPQRIAGNALWKEVLDEYDG